MKTIKIIDLLNKIANGEEVPKKIKFCYRTFEYDDISDYLCIDKNNYLKEDYCNGYSIHKWIFGSNLNDEVEILEEPKKIPEKIIIEQESTGNYYIKNKYGTKCYLTKHSKIFADKINEILDYLERKENE